MSCCFVGWRPKFIVCQFCFIFINFPKLLVSCRDESFGCFGSLNTHPMSKYASGTDVWSLGATCLGTKLTGKFHRRFLNIRQEAGPQKGKSSSNLKCFRCQLVAFLEALKSSGSSGSTWWPWEICLLVGGPRWWVRVVEAGRNAKIVPLRTFQDAQGIPQAGPHYRYGSPFAALWKQLSTSSPAGGF